MICNCRCYCGMRNNTVPNDKTKTNSVKFYKNIFLNIVCGLEFLNEKYDPCGFRLKDWSKQVASDMEDYTEVFEKLYEKYRPYENREMEPETKLYFMTLMSAVTHHLSQALFDSKTINNTFQNNPAVINNLLRRV